MNARAKFEADLLELRPSLMAYAMTRTRDKSAAEDLVSDTMVRALHSWQQFVDGTNFKAWIFRILINCFISGLRSRKIRPEGANPDGMDMLASTLPSQDDLVEHADVRRVLKHLPLPQRHVLIRVCLEGRSYEEVAAEICVSIGTVKSRLWRAREAIEMMFPR